MKSLNTKEFVLAVNDLMKNKKKYTIDPKFIIKVKDKTIEELIIDMVREYHKEWVKLYGNDKGWIEGLFEIIEEGKKEVKAKEAK